MTTCQNTLLNWSEPVTRPFVGGDWVKFMVPHWEMILGWIHGIPQDPLLETDFRAACEILDRRPQPSTPDSANQRWRECVVALCKALDAWKVRYAQRKRAAQRHKERR